MTFVISSQVPDEEALLKKSSGNKMQPAEAVIEENPVVEMAQNFDMVDHDV
jgi:hypothetical protein